MKIATFLNSGLFRSFAVAALVAGGTTVANAQTFIDGGVVYKITSGKAVPQKPTTVPENGDAPGDYTGDYNIPAKVTYNGKTYVVSKTGTGFKGTNLHSITLAAGLTVDRGAFQDCPELVSCVLPSDLVTFQSNVFTNCAKLEKIVIPGTVKEIMSATFQGCSSLKEMTIESGETPIEMQLAAFGSAPAVEKLILNRAIGTKYTAMDTKPFRNSPNLKELEIGGTCKSLADSYFANTPNLVKVTITNDFESFGAAEFSGSGITEFTFPTTVTDVPSQMFQGSKQLVKVTLCDGIKSIGASAFASTPLAEINLPESLKTIANTAFSNTNLAGAITIPEGVTSIGDQAFANNPGITSISIPATLTNIGNGAFMACSGITSFSVAADNETYMASADGKYIATKDGQTLIAYATAAEGTEFSGDFTTIAPYAFYCAQNLNTINLPNCENWGDYALYGTKITSVALKGTIGRYVTAACANLTEMSINATTVPMGVATDCTSLTKVDIVSPVTIVRQDAFKNCVKLESLNLGNILAILEADCFAGSGVKNLTVAAYYPASMTEGVFTADTDITVTVPVDLVDAYKAATGWSYLNIVGDANLAVGGQNMGMPAGLYYAGDDDDLHCYYADGNSDVYPMGLKHTFQLLQFSNRIYGACAGAKFWYLAVRDGAGDGKLFYISKVGDNVFQATVLDNTGGDAYKDPTGLYIYGSTLYVNDRNVCIRKIAADAIALPLNYPSWMENNWMPFYNNNPWSYGCIKNGFAITQDEDANGNPEPLYWVGMKYNGNGLFSFKEKNIGSSEGMGPAEGASAYLTSINLIATSFNIDEKHGDLYMYIEYAGSSEENVVKGGLYRIKLEDLMQNPDPSPADFMEALAVQLIDGSPVKYEGNSTNEHVGITQLAIDENNEYLYWCYRAPDQEEADLNESQDYATTAKGRYWWAEKYDASNPLHHSGIKRIKLGEENPVVEMVAPGVTGYGIVPVNFEGSTKPGTGVESAKLENAAQIISVNGAEVYVNEAATLYVFNAAGALVDCVELAAGATYNTNALTAGVYVLEAKTADARQAVKIAK